MPSFADQNRAAISNPPQPSAQPAWTTPAAKPTWGRAVNPAGAGTIGSEAIGPAETGGSLFATVATLAVVGGLFWLVTSGPSPRTNPRGLRYDERKGWTGTAARTLYHVTDTRTGRTSVRDTLRGVGPSADIRLATRAEADAAEWPAGWIVADDG